MQSYTFVLKNKLGKTNRVVDALSQRVTLLGTIIVKSVGLELIKVDYEVNEDFFDA